MKIKFFIIFYCFIFLGISFSLEGCSFKNITDNVKSNDTTISNSLGETPTWITKLNQTKYATQLFVVAAYDKTTAWVSMYNKDVNSNWQIIMSTPGFIGKDGLGETKESESKTPVGTFGFDAAFGIADDPGCEIPYTKVDNNILVK